MGAVKLDAAQAGQHEQGTTAAASDARTML